MRLVILFDMLLSPSFKMTTGFTKVAGATASTSKFIYYEINQIIRNWVFEKFKTNLMLKFSLQNSLQSFDSLFLIWCERLPIYGNLK